ncbi:MAG: histidine kinase N-terminal 7TM domain-containing protein [Gemmatimonadaceae bacterium]
MRGVVQFLPILTTAFALAFAAALVRRYRSKGGGRHLAWWAIGTLTYAAGTTLEASITLFGWHEWMFRLWYIFGALLGGAPLAQGSVYLHLPKRVADRLTILLVVVIAVGSALVLIAPINHALIEPFRPTGKVLAWPWVRWISPFVNLYAFIFLVGGAAISARNFFRDPVMRHRAIGNVWIAVGALLPGVGGSFTRFGYTEVLYVTELVGIVLIYIGFGYATRDASALPLSPPSSLGRTHVAFVR